MINLMADIYTLNPMEYTMVDCQTDRKTIESVIGKYYDDLRKIGEALATLNILPIIEEPSQKGVFRTSGNIGVRVKELPGFLITGSQVEKSKLKKEDIVYVESVDYYKATYNMQGRVKPSREVLIHDLIYRNFPDIHLVLHTHDNLILQYGGFPTTKFQSFAANYTEAYESVELLKQNQCMCLKDHGQMVMGKTVDEILDTIAEAHNQALVNFRKQFKLPVPI